MFVLSKYNNPNRTHGRYSAGGKAIKEEEPSILISEQPIKIGGSISKAAMVCNLYRHHVFFSGRSSDTTFVSKEQRVASFPTLFLYRQQPSAFESTDQTSFLGTEREKPRKRVHRN
ncbi:hypothetical protein PRUPE_1G467700 [Prunus persica]|uniref:Uncharacterized protein n=1 Tax=Prunus persica TaxID=3760 RepID=A0A251RDU0_PRUPE|nr:hypothetical protein PRUPE_1G467700 [Prunus persica]